MNDAFVAIENAKTVSEEISNIRDLIKAGNAVYEAVRGQVKPTTDALQQISREALDVVRSQLAELAKNPPFPKGYKVSYTWNPALRPFEPVFLLGDKAGLSITAEAETRLQLNGEGASLTANYSIQGLLSDFSINLIGNPSFVTLHFDSLKFVAKNGVKPDIQMKLNSVTFGESMGYVKDLAALLSPKQGPFIELGDNGIRAGYRFAVETQIVGGFVLSGLRFEVAASLPFDGTPVRCIFQISSQQSPFLLSYGIYGGGGFLGLHLGLDGVELLEGALEFGLVGAMSIGPIKGRGFVVAGIYFSISKDSSKVCGFVHANGHMDIFGFISLTVDVYVGICYISDGSVYGEARVSIHIKIAFFSKTFRFTTVQKYAGSGSQRLAMLNGSAQMFSGDPAPSAEMNERLVGAEYVPPFPTAKEWNKYISQYID